MKVLEHFVQAELKAMRAIGADALADSYFALSSRTVVTDSFRL